MTMSIVDSRQSNTLSYNPLKRLGLGLVAALASLCMLSLPALAGEPEGLDGMSTAEASRSGATRATKHPGKRATKGKRTRRTRRSTRREGAYFTGGVGLISVADQPRDLGLEDGTGINLGLGYRLTPDLALEARFLGSLHDAQDNNARNQAALPGGSLNLKYFFPLGSDRLEAFAEGGLGIMNIESDTEQIDGNFFDLGGGIDYRVSRETALGAKASFISIFGEDDRNDEIDLNTFTLMATLSFQL